jgi:hypothetical protein
MWWTAGLRCPPTIDSSGSNPRCACSPRPRRARFRRRRRRRRPARTRRRISHDKRIHASAPRTPGRDDPDDVATAATRLEPGSCRRLPEARDAAAVRRELDADSKNAFGRAERLHDLIAALIQLERTGLRNTASSLKSAAASSALQRRQRQPVGSSDLLPCSHKPLARRLGRNARWLQAPAASARASSPAARSGHDPRVVSQASGYHCRTDGATQAATATRASASTKAGLVQLCTTVALVAQNGPGRVRWVG